MTTNIIPVGRFGYTTEGNLAEHLRLYHSNELGVLAIGAVTDSVCLESFVRKILREYKWDNGSFLSNSRTQRIGRVVSRLIQEKREESQWSSPEIRSRLEKQFAYSKKQMNSERDKAFEYRSAPRDWGKIINHGNCERKPVTNYQVGIAHAQGRRVTMEDEHLAVSFDVAIQGRAYTVQLFGIFDGHGGREVATFVKDHLQDYIHSHLVKFNPTGLTNDGIWNALKIAIGHLNLEVKDRPHFNRMGTTATLAMILDGKLWTANVGDSRTVIENRGDSIQMTEDAKPDNPRYKKGVENRGGFVRTSDCPRVNGDLAIARAIGDHRLNGAVSAPAKVTMIPLGQLSLDFQLILCCDGVYDVASTRQVVGAAHTHQILPVDQLARNIIYSAHQSGSNDNLSCMVVRPVSS